jgi:predicted RNA-binding Zn ribbon-like protein
LLAFARQVGYVTDDAVTDLSRASVEKAVMVSAAFSLALELRGAIYRIFSSRAQRRDVPIDEVERINELLGETLSRRRIGQRDGDFVWSWTEDDVDDLRAPIWPIVESAATLLTSGDLDRVRECNAEDCNWLFLDRSRAGTRRWCSMKSCGNRAKARRHYRRQRNS